MLPDGEGIPTCQVQQNLPAVEAALAARAQTWASILLKPTSDTGDGPSASGRSPPASSLPPSTTASAAPCGLLLLSEALPRAVSLRKASLAVKRQAVQRELILMLRTAVQLVTMYGKMDREMISFADQEIVQHQAILDQVKGVIFQWEDHRKGRVIMLWMGDLNK